ncbi:hypothetical protein ULMS_20570 [Patiriisocius marinistellae]|uniref:Outer membrane protein beta-barrel domain-containing protein n=1 Tax=Patiriisocius marinistellae TaxID=2494560 RepID=A0A5J4G1K2_9FLAO|nr:outer membrane beta-barrel protein [Patiriisocius marinistellae]GEQ86549.1 hypothetical protein ULMS_20570 [Patiriisocius marinistellae]
MKKVLFLICMVCGISAVNAQGFKAGFGVGYLTEIDGVGVSADLIYEFDEKWGIGNTNTFSTAEFNGSDRINWFAIDLNARYKVYKELYVLAGGEYLSQSLKTKNLFGGFQIGDATFKDSSFGANVGAGYKIHLVSNVNLFGEIKYTTLSLDRGVENSGYIHARVGLLFDF